MDSYFDRCILFHCLTLFPRLMTRDFLVRSIYASMPLYLGVKVAAAVGLGYVVVPVGQP
jgi:hypothetical protein